MKVVYLTIIIIQLFIANILNHLVVILFFFDVILFHLLKNFILTF